jgi:hypothetical protein
MGVRLAAGLILMGIYTDWAVLGGAGLFGIRIFPLQSVLVQHSLSTGMLLSDYDWLQVDYVRPVVR